MSIVVKNEHRGDWRVNVLGDNYSSPSTLKRVRWDMETFEKKNKQSYHQFNNPRGYLVVYRFSHIFVKLKFLRVSTETCI